MPFLLPLDTVGMANDLVAVIDRPDRLRDDAYIHDYR